MTQSTTRGLQVYIHRDPGLIPLRCELMVDSYIIYVVNGIVMIAYYVFFIIKKETERGSNFLS